jgi:hypothetical protein
MSGLRAATSRLRERLSGLGWPYPRTTPSAADRAAALLRRPFDRHAIERAGRLDELRALGTARREGDGPRILLLSLRAWPNHVAYEGVLAHALSLRGADVHVLTCGGGQPACELGWGREAQPRPCDRCAYYTDALVDALGVPGHRLAERLPWGPEARSAPREPSALTPAVDPYEATRISVPWFLRTAEPEAAPEGTALRCDFAVAAAGVDAAAAEILDDVAPDIVLMVNGLFGDEAVIRALAVARGIRVATYELAPRGGALVFSNDVPAPEYDTSSAWERYAEHELTSEQRRSITDLLAARSQGVGAHERFFDTAAESNAQALRDLLGLSAADQVVTLFTNLSWDSASLFHDRAYPSMMDWIEDAIVATGEASGTALVIRIHPSEVKWASRESVEAEMGRRFGQVPGHVRWVRADEALSSYALSDLSDLVLVYASTMGLEAATRGSRVAVAADTHYRGRGFTTDLTSPADLRQALVAPGPLPDEQREAALRYAHVFFFRAMVPFAPVQVEGQVVRSIVDSVDRLRPGRDAHLDWICDRVLDGGDFVLPDELAAST